MNKSLRYILIGVFLLLLVAVRLFENNFFNDGLIVFFKSKYLTAKLPEITFFNHFKIVTFRYLINSLLSIFILLLLFKQKYLTHFLILLYTTIFIFLSIIYYWIWIHYKAGEYLNLFYVRRFFIQPLLLFLLIPALLYKKNTNKKN